MSILVITRLTIRESSRRWILWAALFLGILFLTVYALGFRAIYLDMHRTSSVSAIIAVEFYSFLLMAGLYVVNFLCMAMSVLSSVDTLSGEIASGTIHTLVSKPLHRWQVLLGKWLAFEFMLTLYFGMMAGGVLAIVRLLSGYMPRDAFSGLVYMWINTAIFLSLSFFGGAYFTTLANGVLAFGLYGVSFIGGWMEQIGTFLNNQTAVNIGIFCSLLMPAEALWRKAASTMQSALETAMGGITASPFSFESNASTLFIVYSIVYGLVALLLAIRRFEQRDL